MSCKDDGMCKTAAVCFLNGCQAEATTASASVEIGAGDPEAFFAEFCERQGYPSDSDMDAGLRATFYEGIRYCSVNSRAPAPIATASASFQKFDLTDYSKPAIYSNSADRAPAPSRNAAPLDEQARCESENAEFTEWWNREQACPEHSLITENAAHAAWQERSRRAALTQQSAAQAPADAAELTTLLEKLHAHWGDCLWIDAGELMALEKVIAAMSAATEQKEKP